MIGKFNILVVDDDPDKAHLLEFALQMAGYDVRIAWNGEEGLAVIDSYQPDLVIADVMMPLVDGYELARRIRANPKTRFIPVILQTAGRHNAEDLRRGSEVGALGYITDPTDLDLLLARASTLLDFKSYLDSCEEAAFTDHLTGLANRRRFERQLDREVARTQRYGHTFSLLMLDIDHFKLVNDNFGHEAGDQTLTRLGRVLQQGTRGIDLAARIGGEEFAIILTETEMAGALEVAERLRVAIKGMDIPNVGTITASFGVAECSVGAVSSRELVAAADAALYEAKGQGRDCVAVARGQSNSKMAGGVQG
ncbi:MAG TPA: diguanylate cyclase [Nitrosospira sp.]